MSIDALLSRSIEGKTTPEEEAIVLAWRQAAPANEVCYRELSRVLGLLERLPDGVDAGAPPPATELMRIAEGRAQLRQSGAKNPRRHSWRLIVQASAAAVLVLVGYGIKEVLPPGNGAGPGFGAEEFVTAQGERATVALRDGTVVRLAPGSRLRITGGESGREVSLVGRAYFAVAKREGRPFRIHTASGAVTVLGTRFDMEAREEGVRLVVVEGRVSLAAEDGETLLGAGEMGRIRNGRSLPPMKIAEVEPFVSWVGNFLAFQSTPLREVATEVERQYGVRMEIADEQFAGRVVTAWFTDADLHEVVQVICLAAVAECTLDGDTIQVRPRS